MFYLKKFSYIRQYGTQYILHCPVGSIKYFIFYSFQCNIYCIAFWIVKLKKYPWNLIWGYTVLCKDVWKTVELILSKKNATAYRFHGGIGFTNVKNPPIKSYFVLRIITKIVGMNLLKQWKKIAQPGANCFVFIKNFNGQIRVRSKPEVLTIRFAKKKLSGAIIAPIPQVKIPYILKNITVLRQFHR